VCLTKEHLHINKLCIILSNQQKVEQHFGRKHTYYTHTHQRVHRRIVFASHIQIIVQTDTLQPIWRFFVATQVQVESVHGIMNNVACWLAKGQQLFNAPWTDKKIQQQPRAAHDAAYFEMQPG